MLLCALDSAAAGAGPPADGHRAAPARLVEGPRTRPTALPREGLLMALSRWGTSTLCAFDASGRTMTPLVTATTGDPLVSSAGGLVAYLVRRGADPAENYVEILDPGTAKRLRLRAAAGCAILGFVLDPGGRRMAYTAINLRDSSSRRVSWHSGLADLRSYRVRVSPARGPRDPTGAAVPAPFAWSARTGEIYLRGVLPFRGMAHQGIWAMAPGGSRLRQIVPEPSYTGTPSLSPDGRYLAYLSTRVDALPKTFIASPGAPPGNALVVLDLATERESTLAEAPGGAFGAFAWSEDGAGVLATRRRWRERRFRDAAFLGVRPDLVEQPREIRAASPASPVSGLAACRGGSLYWVEEGREESRLRGVAAEGREPATLFATPADDMSIVGCLEEMRSR